MLYIALIYIQMSFEIHCSKTLISGWVCISTDVISLCSCFQAGHSCVTLLLIIFQTVFKDFLPFPVLLATWPDWGAPLQILLSFIKELFRYALGITSPSLNAPCSPTIRDSYSLPWTWSTFSCLVQLLSFSDSSQSWPPQQILFWLHRHDVLLLWSSMPPLSSYYIVMFEMICLPLIRFLDPWNRVCHHWHAECSYQRLINLRRGQISGLVEAEEMQGQSLPFGWKLNIFILWPPLSCVFSIAVVSIYQHSGIFIT